MRYIIGSASENGYWNNSDGWGARSSASEFSAAERRRFSLPLALGNDARWVALSGPKKADTNPNGAIVWRGASLLNGAPVVAIVTGLKDDSDNGKTGAMLQLWILADGDEAPHIAQKTGGDVAVCGDCPQRPAVGGACYVLTFQGPRSVYECHKRGAGYRDVSGDLDAIASLGAGRMVRLGAYGDPAAMPADVLQALVSQAEGHTGYTHQWRTAGDVLRGLCMASADSATDAVIAQAQGWRTFRLRKEGEAAIPREAVCPASEEAGRKLNCAQCKACNGAASGRRGSIVIYAHGSRA